MAKYFNFKNKNKKLNMQLVYDLAVMFLGFYPREMKPYIHIDFLYKYTGQFYLQEPQIRNNSYDLEWNECINKLYANVYIWCEKLGTWIKKGMTHDFYIFFPQ